MVTVTIVALVRAERCDIPVVFGAFARAFGFHANVAEREEKLDTEQMGPAEETDQPGEAA
ncbi:hypothetical protein [Nocardia amikacinitolerans]|uniref:hypothetical protein n=1 Tax=Nocardia amikacinitolerans TaxID=756689 RepID=UPI00117FFC20|nr:hypothetical protein [Nocardia amikacinitolerans]